MIATTRIVTFWSLLLYAASVAIAAPSLAPAPEKTSVVYRMVDEHPVRVDVHRLPDDQLRPVIVYFHGGALIKGSREAIFPEIMAMAKEGGYAIVSFDYRLAPETKLPEIVGDLEAGFAWLEREGAQRFKLDMNRMIVAGNSAGGYLALVAGYRSKRKPKAILSLNGYGRLNEDWYSKPNPHPEYTGKKIDAKEAEAQVEDRIISNEKHQSKDRSMLYMYYRQNGLWPREVSGFDADMEARLLPYEPARNITPDYPPVFLMHGTGDQDVPYEESVNLTKELGRNGVPYIFMGIEGAGHGFKGGDANQLMRSYAGMRKFAGRFLEPK